MFIIEQRYGNDGYVFWFKLLELLGSSEGHYYDCNDPANWEYLQGKTGMDADKSEEILNLLAKLDAIDSELWENDVIWSSNFIKGISDAYRNRRVEPPKRPDNYTKKPVSTGISTSSLQVDNRILNETKLNETKEPPLPPKGGCNGFDEFWKSYPKKIGKGAALKKWEGLKRLHRLPPLETIVAAIEAQKSWEQWQKEEGQFIPNPATWLNQGRWDDQPPEGGKPEWMRNLSEG